MLVGLIHSGYSQGHRPAGEAAGEFLLIRDDADPEVHENASSSFRLRSDLQAVAQNVIQECDADPSA